MKILITGAAGGFAYLTALTLAQRKHFVYLTCHTLKEVKYVKEKTKGYKNIEVLKIDITNDEDRKKVLSLDIDCLWNNAAIGQGGSLLEANMDRVKQNFEVNVFSTLKLTQMVLKKMVEKNKGRIIVTSSMARYTATPFISFYAATKASESLIIRALQRELFLIKSKVKVVLIEPGLYCTGFNHLVLDSKYDGGKYFKSIRKPVHVIENLAFKLLEKKNFDSIVIKVVRAVEDKNPKKVYRAPFIQTKLIKLYSIFE